MIVSVVHVDAPRELVVGDLLKRKLTDRTNKAWITIVPEIIFYVKSKSIKIAEA